MPPATHCQHERAHGLDCSLHEVPLHPDCFIINSVSNPICFIINSVPNCFISARSSIVYVLSCLYLLTCRHPHSARASDSKSKAPPASSSSDADSEGRDSPGTGGGVADLLCGRFRPGKSKVGGSASPGSNPFQSKFSSPTPLPLAQRPNAEGGSGPSAADDGYAGELSILLPVAFAERRLVFRGPLSP